MHAVAPLRPKVDPCAPPAAPPAMPERPGRALPGTTKPRRFRPRFHYELLVCGLAGHELLGTDAARLRPQDATSRGRVPTACAGTAACGATAGCRWPARAPVPHRPARPRRGRAAAAGEGAARQGRAAAHRDRPGAARRGARAHRRGDLRSSPPTGPAARPRLPDPRRPPGRSGGPTATPGTGLLHELRRLLSVRAGTLVEVGVVVAVYAVLEGRGGRAVAPAALGRVPDLRRHDARAAARALRADAQDLAAEGRHARPERGGGRLAPAGQAPLRPERRRARRARGARARHGLARDRAHAPGPCRSRREPPARARRPRGAEGRPSSGARSSGARPETPRTPGPAASR